ncbi:hypothetical protein F4808DRAFT_295222 [Astrocystis sublimbata]|nr:hypothetical protein F4808DRAFT_295222 [Astrocystis sublimbata]
MSLAPPSLPQDKAASVPPIAVPTHGPGGVFAVACSTTIQGPALSCLEKVLDLPNYGEWNTFVPSASITSTSTSPGFPLQDKDLRDLAGKDGYVTPGAKVRFDAVMVPGGSSRAVDLEVTFLESFGGEEGGRVGRGYRVVWKAVGIPHFLLHSERVQEFIEEKVEGEDGMVVTRYACWETFGGLLAYVLPKAQIESGFQRWMDGLKDVVEGERK